MDLVLLTNLLFQVQDRKAVFIEANRILKIGGRVLIVEWNENATIGPEQKIAKKELKKFGHCRRFCSCQRVQSGKFPLRIDI